MASSSVATFLFDSCVRGYLQDIWQCFDWQRLHQLPLPQFFHVIRIPHPDGTLLQVDARLLRISHDGSFIPWRISSDLSLLLRGTLHIWAAQTLPGSVILHDRATGRSKQGRHLSVGTFNIFWLQLAWQGTVRVGRDLDLAKYFSSAMLLLNNECSHCNNGTIISC